MRKARDVFKRVNNDVNGNPRYVVHFLDCEPESWKNQYVAERYNRVCDLMRRSGGKKYRAKSYGGGIVFNSYDIDELWEKINELKEAQYDKS